MTRVYWGCYSWPGRTFNYTLTQILKRIAGSKYASVDLCEYPMEFWPLSMTERDSRRLKETLKSLGLKVSGITVPTFSPGLELLPDKKDRAIMIKRLKKAIDLTSYLEGETVMYGISPTEIYGSSLKETYKWNIELFTECASLAEDKDVKVAIEFINTFFQTSDRILEFLDKVDSRHIGLCLETGNLRARPEKETIMEHMEKCGDRIRLVHLNDPVNKKWLRSINIDLLEVLKTLRNFGYNGPLVTEGLKDTVPCSELDTEVSTTAKYLKELMRTASLH